MNSVFRIYIMSFLLLFFKPVNGQDNAIGQVVYSQQVAKQSDSTVTAAKSYISRDMVLYFGKSGSYYQQPGTAGKPAIKFSGDVADSSKLNMDRINDEIKSRLPQGVRNGSTLYRNYKIPVLLLQQTAFDNNFLISDSVAPINWTVTGETRTIAEKKCNKATGSFRGRNYTAWFTQEIPVPAGPWKLGGLPGLILEAYDDKNEVRFNFVSLDIPALVAIAITKESLSGKAVTREEFSREAKKQSERIANMMSASGNKVSVNRVQMVSMEITPAQQ